VCIAAVLIGRLIHLQLISNYQEQADSNAFFRKTIYAPRGTIYDRNGKILVGSPPIYGIEITVKRLNDLNKKVEKFRKENAPKDSIEKYVFDTVLLCKLINISKETFISKLNNIQDKNKNPYYSSRVPQRLLTQMTETDKAALDEQLWKFDGISISKRTTRQYFYPNAAHALGSIGEVSKKDIEKYDSIYKKEEIKRYKQGDYIGISGVEKQYEEELRGTNGAEIYMREANGVIKEKYKNGGDDISPIGGKTLKLTLDIDLQAYGELLMQNKVGSIVCIEPSSGELLALVSSPTFDPSILVGRQRSENYPKLLKDPFKPLFDRPLMAFYPPGSTFKVANALIFEHEQIIDKNTRYPCHAGYVIGSFRVGCHLHSSPLDLPNSISNSCNAYFCAGLRALLDNKKYGNIQNAFNAWKKDIVSFGFGYRLGVDLPNESRGFIPNTEVYDKIHGKNRWKSLNIVSISIGQGEITVTPVQLANLAAVIANRGYWIRPHILKEIEGEKLDTFYTNKNFTVVEPEYFEPVIQGMEWAVNGGGSGSTARIAKLDDIIICGKTGTAENPRGDNHSIFLAFAPKDNPKIAIAIVVENAGFGATWAAPIVSLMIEKYLKGSIAENRKLKEKQIVEANLMPKKAY
jgi:penicillin-binding protein 2